MTKKIICTVLALIICFGLAISVSAEEKNVDFVVDEVFPGKPWVAPMLSHEDL